MTKKIFDPFVIDTIERHILALSKEETYTQKYITNIYLDMKQGIEDRLCLLRNEPITKRNNGNKQYKNGKAYEFAIVEALVNILHSRKCIVRIIEDQHYKSANKYFNSLSNEDRAEYMSSATSGINYIINLEPMICGPVQEELEIRIQGDNKALIGDVRDIVLYRPSYAWEIGISCKHNNKSIKSSRINKDFFNKNFEVNGSTIYDKELSVPNAYIENNKGSEWTKEIKNKFSYLPTRNALQREMSRQSENNKHFALKVMMYCLGTRDCYIITSFPKKTSVEAINICNNMNKSFGAIESKIKTQVLEKPKHLICKNIDETDNTLLIEFDNGLSVKWRIHNDSKKIGGSNHKLDTTICKYPPDMHRKEIINMVPCLSNKIDFSQHEPEATNEKYIDNGVLRNSDVATNVKCA